MVSSRLIEYIFFFGLVGVVGYLVWELFSPFVGSLALAAIVVTICRPLYRKILKHTPRKQETIAALFTTLLVVFIVFVPVFILGTLIFREAVSIYTLFSSGAQATLTLSLQTIDQFIAKIIPGFSLDIIAYAQQAAAFVASHITTIFAGTASTIFFLFISLIATFYFFRDGREFTRMLIEISPLPDDQDEIILSRLERSVRSVVLGTVLVALIQGILTAIGLSLFGFDRAILWGSIASFGALIPGIGTSIVFIPAIGYLLLTGAYAKLIGVAIWAMLAVGLIDNFLGPYLISRGGTLHPFFILLAVLGGISFFGPIGFILGPVILSLFKVLIELYGVHIAHTPPT
jgi:predicted PurR-regulated permease PerM